MGSRWVLMFCLFVLGLARSAQGDSRLPLTKDSKDEQMMRYDEVKTPEWNEDRRNSYVMSDGSQQPLMAQGALARDDINTEKPALLARGPRGGGGKGRRGLTKAERDALAEAARLAAEEKRKRDEEKANQG